MTPRFLFSLMVEGDPLFGAIEAWLHGLTPASFLAHSLGRGDVGKVPAAPAPSHLLRGAGAPEPKVRDTGKVPAAPAPSHLLRGAGAPEPKVRASRAVVGTIKVPLTVDCRIGAKH